MDCLAVIMTTGLNDLKSLSLERRQYDRQFEDLFMTIMNMAMVETLSCSLQTRNTKFLIAPRLNQVSMSMCLKSPVLV